MAEVARGVEDDTELEPWVEERGKGGRGGEEAEEESVPRVSLNWEGRWCIRLGRIHVVRLGSVLLYIGPHWYCTVLMLGIVCGVGWMFVYGVAVDLGTNHIVGGVAVTVGTAASLLQCALGDPGILQASPHSDGGRGTPLQFMPSTGRRSCNACGIIQPRGSLHCEFCEVCIVGWDHHCPWMSKCIGASNVRAFYTFLCMGLGSLLYIVVITIAVHPAPP